MGDQSQIMGLRTFGRTMLGRQPGYKPTRQELAADIALYKEYQKEAIKLARPGFTPTASEVTLPDGSKRVALATSPNSVQYVDPSQNTWSPERVVMQDGTVGLMDKNTGGIIKAWDVNTGAPVKASTKGAGDVEAALLGQQQDLAVKIKQIQSGAGWYFTDAGRQKDIAAKQAELNAILNPASVLTGAPAPSPAASPTPQATPAPTPQATPTPDSAYLSTPMPTPSPEATPAPTPVSMSSADYQSKYGRAMKPGRYRTKSGAEVLITD